VLCAADSVQAILSEDLTGEIALVEDLSLGGIPVQRLGGRGNETSGGTMPFNASYNSRWIEWLIHILGNYEFNPNATNADFTDHLISVAQSVSGLFGTLVVGHGSVDVFEYGNSKPSELEFVCTGEAPLLQGTQTFINRQRVENTDATVGAVNKPSTLATATPIVPTVGVPDLLAVFSHLSLGLRNAGDTAYTPVCASEIGLRVARPQEGDFTTCLDGTISEPVAVNFVECSGSFVIPNYGDDAVLQELIALNDSKEPRAFFMIWESPVAYQPLLPPGVKLQLEFVFPECQFTTVGPNASGPGKMPVTVTFQGKRKTDPAAVVFDSTNTAIPLINTLNAEGVFVRVVNTFATSYNL
jgi:hypothetical protein